MNIENTNDAATATNKIENILTSVKRKKNEDYYSRDSLLQEVIKHRTELEKKRRRIAIVQEGDKNIEKKLVADYEARLESIIS